MKCKFFKICGNPESVTCSKEEGIYYSEGRAAGCYRRLEEKAEAVVEVVQ